MLHVTIFSHFSISVLYSVHNVFGSSSKPLMRATQVQNYMPEINNKVKQIQGKMFADTGWSMAFDA